MNPVSLTPLEFITVLRDSRPDSLHYFTHGGCWELFRILRQLWPQALPFHSWTDMSGHVATSIDGRLYDIRGYIRRPKLYQPFVCGGCPSLNTGHRPHRWHRGYRPEPKAT